MSIFTEDQVESLNAYQACGQWHPFTCGNHCGATLIATTDGWICPTEGCGYTQDWAHSFMADGSWKRSLDLMHRAAAHPTQQRRGRTE